MKKIILGEVQFKGNPDMWEEEIYTGEVNIEKETEKAIRIVFRGEVKIYEIDENDQLGELIESFPHKEGHWLPKSKVKVEENVIFVPEWLVRKNHIRFAE